MTFFNNDPTLGIMVCGHGSRDVGAVSQFLTLVEALRGRFPNTPVEGGFLEFATPVIRDSLQKLSDAGATRILAVPSMLFAAGHVKNDLPWEINTFAANNPHLTIEFGRELGVDPKLLKASRARIQTAIDEADAHHGPVPLSDTLLLVIGRGTNDPDSNANVHKVSRLLWEGMSFGWSEVAYSGVTQPSVDVGIDHVARLGYRRVIVFPYFLFTGILVRRIYALSAEARLRHPTLQIIDAGYLNDHPQVVDSFVERITDIVAGTVAMNCQLCKYREQVIGFEDAVGAVQAGHHHHVSGIGTDADHGHGHGHRHGHEQHHGHTHAYAARPKAKP